MALKMLVHFVGDVHQPLHCAERDHDQGGNGVAVKFLDRTGTLTLHSVWDDKILEENMQEDDPEDYALAIQAKISAQQKMDWEHDMDPIHWAGDGLKLAKDIAYQGVPEQSSPFVIDQHYVDRAKPVVEHQIQKAGVRLAKLLNEIFQ